jgi:hypothetical protein
MHFGVSFYRVAAVSSMLTALTTLLLIFLPRFFAPVEGFEGRMSRVEDPAYVLRSWAYLVHPFLVLMAALGIAMRIRRLASAAAVVGLISFSLWAFTEAGQQTLTLFAFDKWRAAYFTADELMRAQIRTNTLLYDGIWDAMYFLLLIGFALANSCFGAALVTQRGLTRIVGGFLLAASALTLALMAQELRWFVLPEPLASWSYPAIQPLGRLLIGVWLWRVADETKPLTA